MTCVAIFILTLYHVKGKKVYHEFCLSDIYQVGLGNFFLESAEL